MAENTLEHCLKASEKSLFLHSNLSMINVIISERQIVLGHDMPEKNTSWFLY